MQNYKGPILEKYKIFERQEPWFRQESFTVPA